MCLCADDSTFSTGEKPVGEKSVAKRPGEKSLGEKIYMGAKSLGENKGKWDAGFRSPFSGMYIYIYIYICIDLYIILHYIILYYIMLCYIILYYIILYYHI